VAGFFNAIVETAVRLAAAVLAFLCVLGRQGPALVAQVNDQSVTKAIDRAVNYLYAAAGPGGIWDSPAATDVKALGNKASCMDHNWGGRTALVLGALASAGQQGDPRFRKALLWLVEQEITGTYAVGLRLNLMHNLRKPEDFSRLIRRDANLLGKGVHARDKAAYWSYFPGPKRKTYGGTPKALGDYSNINYAVLGLWAAREERVEVPRSMWLALERTYVLGQHENGGWSYFPARQNTPKTPGYWSRITASMTTAGIASLYLVLDYAYVGRGNLGSYRKTSAYKSIQRGLKWMGENFNSRRNPGRPEWSTYYFYNCERVGAAAGLKYFGTHDWFREIAATILSRQRADGSIPVTTPAQYGGVLVDTAYSLLFLTAGSAPIIMNKLQHEGDWDNHLRELAPVTHWLARISERPANWQIVHLQVPAEDLTDSRILYIAGTRPLQFSQQQRDKLKRYVALGGLLLFIPDRDSLQFSLSVHKLLAQIWPELEMTRVDLASHPLGDIHRPLKNTSLRIEQLATPTRVLAFLVHGDPARAWQQRRYSTARAKFYLAANLHYFATDGSRFKDLPTKLTFFAEPFRRPMPPTSRTIRLARIKHHKLSHRWDPEPLAMEHFARVLARKEGIGCEVRVVSPQELAASGAKFAHLTGAGEVQLTPQQSQALLAFLSAGGTLIVDQAGGPLRQKDKPSFDKSFRRLVAGWYGPEAMRHVPAGDPLFRGMQKVLYRHIGGMRRQSRQPMLEHVVRGGRTVIYYSKYDLTCGLLGNPNPMVIGLSPKYCYEVLKRILTAQARQGSASQPAKGS